MVILADDVHRRAKEYALRRGATLSAIVEEALREKLAPRDKPTRKRRVRLPTFRGDGLMPGVSLDHMGSIHDRMDEGD